MNHERNSTNLRVSVTPRQQILSNYEQEMRHIFTCILLINTLKNLQKEKFTYFLLC